MLWFPLPPGSSNPLGASDAVCVGTNSSPGGATAFFEFPSFGIPASDVITGVEIKPKYRTNDAHYIQLTDGGTPIGTQQTLPLNFPGTSTCASTSVVSIGGPADLLGTSGLTPADFNAGDIGVRIELSITTIGGGDPGSVPLDLDSIELVVHHVSGLNTAPVADAGGPYTVAEGGSITLDGAGSYDDDGDSLTYAWDLDNDGAFDDATGVSPTFSAAGRNGPDSQTIKLRVNDGTVDSAPVSATVIIDDVGPVIDTTSVSPTNVSEGGSVAVSGTFVDPALALETYTVTADWSDGTTTPVTVGSGTFSTSRSFPDDHPSTGTPSDVFTVDFTVTDVATSASFSSTAFPITVFNVTPGLVFDTPALSINEGDTATFDGTIFDPALGVPTETFTGSGLWSDGAGGVVFIAAGTFTSSRTFVDDDPTGTASDGFTLDVTVADDDTGTRTETSPVVTVNNVDPVITALAVSPTVDEDGTVSLTGAFTDVGIADTHTVSVDWGEGSPEAAAVVQAAGSGTFSASHQYLDDDPTGSPADTYTITVTVTDDDTGSDTATVDTIVANVDPTIDAIASDATFADKAEEGETVTVSGAFSDVGTLDTHTASIDWGDGTVTAATVVQGAGGGTYSGDHAYTSGGVYAVTVTVTDDDTGSATATTTAVVTGVGVNGGVLQVVGTNGDDKVKVKLKHGDLEVSADFLDPKQRSYDASSVTSIEIWLCDGDDDAKVYDKIDLPATIHGGDGDDKLYGGAGPDTILGDDGDDKVMGGDGGDLIDGGDGDDKLWGESGDDTMFGGDGDDDMKGGKGDDFLDGGLGDDKIHGDDGDDTLIGGGGDDDLKGGKGTNIYL